MRAKKRSGLILTTTALAVATAAWAASPADDVTFTGHILDDATGVAVSAAQVFIADLNIGVLSQQDGAYVLHVPRASIGGAVTLTVQRIGYAQATEVVDGDELMQEVVTRDVRLKQESLQLNEVVVAGTAKDTPGPTPDNRVERSATNQGRGTSAHPRAEEPSGRPTAPVDYERIHSPTTGMTPRRSHVGGGQPGWNREQYDHIAENDFHSVRDEPLSTFSIDVDRASYSNIRRFLLREHRLPPADAVQVEEMINYFSYDYALPRGNNPVAITTELGTAPWNKDHQLLRIGLASRPVVTEELPPSNLVFLLDVSGSMQSPDKLPLVKRSLRLLVDQLRPRDRVAIVVYAGAAGLVLEPTSGSHKGRILDAIERLEAGGSTAGGAGLRLAYKVAQDHFLRRGNNRVILATDGDFNVGESSDGAMIRLIEQRRGHGTFLTVLGFGTGNLQAAKMQGIAQHGNGNFAYIDSMEEARKVLVGEMGGTLLTVAQDVKVQVEFNPAHVSAYRLVGYENRLLAAEDFNNDRKDAGDMGAGHRVTALYEIVPADGHPGDGKVDPLRYQSRPDLSRRARSPELAFVRVRYKRPRGTESRLIERPVGIDISSPSDDFQFASAVAGFGMLLRESQYRGSITTRRVLALAEDGLGADLDGYRHEFVDLVRAYERLSPRHERE